MTTKVREEFEVKYPRPEGVAWAGNIGMYVIIDAYKKGITISRYNWLWEGWQASRAAVVVELPSCFDEPPYACYEGGWNDMHCEARDAIEAAGVKCK